MKAIKILKELISSGSEMELFDIHTISKDENPEYFEMMWGVSEDHAKHAQEVNNAWCTIKNKQELTYLTIYENDKRCSFNIPATFKIIDIKGEIIEFILVE